MSHRYVSRLEDRVREQAKQVMDGLDAKDTLAEFVKFVRQLASEGVDMPEPPEYVKRAQEFLSKMRGQL